MKRATKKEFNLNQTPPKVHNLNKSLIGCAPCLEQALKIGRQINKRSVNEIKIEEIKRIVGSIFISSKNDIKKN